MNDCNKTSSSASLFSTDSTVNVNVSNETGVITHRQVLEPDLGLSEAF
ncbi:hypothetical protein AB6H17_00645 [Proteus vulgaris]